MYIFTIKTNYSFIFSRSKDVKQYASRYTDEEQNVRG